MPYATKMPHVYYQIDMTRHDSHLLKCQLDQTYHSVINIPRTKEICEPDVGISFVLRGGQVLALHGLT